MHMFQTLSAFLPSAPREDCPATPAASPALWCRRWEVHPNGLLVWRRRCSGGARRHAAPLSDDSGLLQHNRTRMMEVRYNVVAWRFLCRSHFHSFTTFLKSFPAVLVLFLKFPFEAPPKCHFVK